jgi:hypothetical protein
VPAPPAVLLLAAAWAGPLELELDLAPGHAAHVRLEAAGGAIAHEARVMDGDRRTGFGWLEDADPEPGRVRADLGPVLVPPGAYTLVVEGPEGTNRRPLDLAPRAERLVEIAAPAEATAVRAVLDRGGEGPANAWAPVVDGVARLPLGPGEWSLRADGAPGIGGRVEPDVTGTVQLHAWPRSWPRTAPDARPAVVWGLLLPVTLVLLALGAAGLLALGRRRGAGLAAGASAGLAALATAGTLAAPGTRLLMSEPGFTDPPTSASLALATADALRHLGDVSTAFSFPEGHSWLALGPSWLGYVLSAPLAWAAGGVVAHNLGQTLCLGLLGLAAWALARERGAAPAPALLAAAGAVLAPSLLGELDEMSLDRAVLFGVPAFVLCLDRAARLRGAGWVLAAGAALASVLYAQTYYGLYLAAAAPLLVLPRLIGPAPHRRLLRLAGVGAVALALMAPWGVAAKAGLGDTVYASDDPVPGLALADPWRPPEEAELAAFVKTYDPRVGGGASERPMDDARSRLLSAIVNANHPDDLWRPGAALAGGAAFWFLWAGALLAARRRGAVLLGGWDVLVLMLLSLGPFLRTGVASLGAALPYHFWFLYLPGFEQLKHPQRFVFLAATLSTVPLAVGWSGLLSRLPLGRGRARSAGQRAARVAATVIAAALLITVAVRKPEEVGDRPSLPIPVGPERVEATLLWTWPVARAFPVPAALSGLEAAPALVLPLETPLPTRAYLGPMQSGMALVNGPPHGTTAGGSGLPAWAESNALLNRMAWLAGSTRPRRPLGEPGLADRVEADLAGLRYIVLYRDLLRAPELLPPLDAWMDENLVRIADQDGVTVWEIR